MKKTALSKFKLQYEEIPCGVIIPDDSTLADLKYPSMIGSLSAHIGRFSKIILERLAKQIE